MYHSEVLSRNSRIFQKAKKGRSIDRHFVGMVVIGKVLQKEVERGVATLHSVEGGKSTRGIGEHSNVGGK